MAVERLDERPDEEQRVHVEARGGAEPAPCTRTTLNSRQYSPWAMPCWVSASQVEPQLVVVHDRGRDADATVIARIAQVTVGLGRAVRPRPSELTASATRVAQLLGRASRVAIAISARSLGGARRPPLGRRVPRRTRSPPRTLDAASCCQARHVRGPSGACVAENPGTARRGLVVEPVAHSASPRSAATWRLGSWLPTTRGEGDGRVLPVAALGHRLRALEEADRDGGIEGPDRGVSEGRAGRAGVGHPAESSGRVAGPLPGPRRTLDRDRWREAQVRQRQGGTTRAPLGRAGPPASASMASTPDPGWSALRGEGRSRAAPASRGRQRPRRTSPSPRPRGVLDQQRRAAHRAMGPQSRPRAGTSASPTPGPATAAHRRCRARPPAGSVSRRPCHPGTPAPARRRAPG